MRWDEYSEWILNSIALMEILSSRKSAMDMHSSCNVTERHPVIDLLEDTVSKEVGNRLVYFVVVKTKLMMTVR